MDEVLESHKRSIAKAITYRIVCVVVLLAVSFALTGNLVQTTYITIIFQTTQTIFYYVHERAWAQLRPLSVEDVRHPKPAAHAT